MNQEKIDRQSREMGEDNDCSVKALALVAHCSYATAHAALERVGRDPREGTPRNLTRLALEALGFQVVTWSGKRLALQVGRRGVMMCDALRDPDAWAELPDMLLFVDKHVGALVDGKVEDWTADRRAVISEAWQVMPIRKTVQLGVEPPPIIYL